MPIKVKQFSCFISFPKFESLLKILAKDLKPMSSLFHSYPKLSLNITSGKHNGTTKGFMHVMRPDVKVTG